MKKRNILKISVFVMMLIMSISNIYADVVPIKGFKFEETSVEQLLQEDHTLMIVPWIISFVLIVAIVVVCFIILKVINKKEDKKENKNKEVEQNEK